MNPEYDLEALYARPSDFFHHEDAPPERTEIRLVAPNEFGEHRTMRPPSSITLHFDDGMHRPMGERTYLFFGCEVTDE